jgi:dTDP-4-dehydrorhamnose reductase
MLGHQLLAGARRDARFEVWCSVRNESALAWIPPDVLPRTFLCDVTDADQVRHAVGQGFDVIINCAGLTKALATDPVLAIRVNSLAPHVMVAAATANSARLIHISTDCVFSGHHGNYSEEDIPDPVDLYGRSKLLGEVTDNRHLTVRTSFIGPELNTRHGLLAWFLAQEGRISGYARVFWSGFTSLALSRILLELALRPEVTGLLHMAGERIDKHSLLCKLQAAFNKRDVVIEPSNQPMCDRSLSNQRFCGLGISYPSLDGMIAELATHGVQHSREQKPV